MQRFHANTDLTTSRCSLTPCSLVLWIALLGSIVSGCDRGNQPDGVDSGIFADPLSSLSESVGSTGSQVTGMANEEFRKLFKWEYKVASLRLNASPAELESQLAALGNDRWECFSVTPTGTDLRVVCKRLPLSVLRAVPYLFNM